VGTAFCMWVRGLWSLHGGVQSNQLAYIWELESGADDDTRRHTWPRVVCRGLDDGVKTRHTH
jgi:hypothetical protein